VTTRPITQTDQATGLQALIIDEVKAFVRDSPLNRLTNVDNSPIWEEPLVGFTDASDPIFDLFKTVVAPFHMTPREVLAAHLQSVPDAPTPDLSQVGVISWVLPVARKTKLSNRRMTEGPSQRWNNTRFQGEEVSVALRHYLVSWLEDRGLLAVAPLLASFYSIQRSPELTASNWSERHIAYAAGLGTFGLSEGLITSKGVAHRVGSVVVNAAFVPTPRAYQHHLEYCLYFADGSCGKCMERCPCGAITPAGHDKAKCRELMNVTQVHWTKKPGYVGHYSGCGLCQTGVPCESGIPRRK
jgi:epoxyqueuosine reductase